MPAYVGAIFLNQGARFDLGFGTAASSMLGSSLPTAIAVILDQHSRCCLVVPASFPDPLSRVRRNVDRHKDEVDSPVGLRF